MKRYVFLFILLLVATARWLTWDMDKTPEIQANKVMRVRDPGGLCADALTYLPTYTGGDTREYIDAGEAYCVEPCYGDGSALSVVLRGDGPVATLGAEVHAPVSLRVRWNGPPPPGHAIVVVREKKEVARSAPGVADLEMRLTEAGSYHIELVRSVPTWWFGHECVTWIVTYPFTLLPAVV